MAPVQAQGGIAQAGVAIEAAAFAWPVLMVGAPRMGSEGVNSTGSVNCLVMCARILGGVLERRPSGHEAADAPETGIALW